VERAPRPGGLEVAAFFGLLGALLLGNAVVPTWLRAHHFGFSNYDLGIYSQALARLAIDPPNPWLSGRQIHLFNDHVDPILFLVAPFTWRWPAVEVALVAEALFALLALVPLAWLAREGRLSRTAWWLLGALLVLDVGVTQGLTFPAHPTTWAMAPLALLLAALLLERWRVALLALVLLLACKEEFPFVGLALVPYAWKRAPRWVAWSFGSLSAVWGILALAVRPWLLGPVESEHAATPFRGLEQGLGAFLALRFAPHQLAAMGNLLAAFLPLAVCLAWKRWRGERAPDGAGWLFLALAPLLGIRFLSMAWQAHYAAVVVAGGVLGLAALLGTRPVPRWVAAATVVLLIAGNEPFLRRTARVLGGQHGWGGSADCPDAPGRVDAVARAIERVRAAPGPLLVSGNLLPWLAERGDVVAYGGEPEGFDPSTVLLEAPTCGDTWGQPTPAREAAWRAAHERTARAVLADDAFVYAATFAR